MEKQRKYKVFSIVVLVVAIVGMTLGFAAFSKVLTINASATITPNEDDFKVVTYGLKDEDSMWEFDGSKEFRGELVSNEKALGYSWTGEGDAIGTEATITNNQNSATISDLNVTFYKENATYLYYFIIKNEGKYDAYIDLKAYEDNGYSIAFDIHNGVCTDNNATITQEDLGNACESMALELDAYEPDGNYVSGTEQEPYYKLEVDSYIYLELYIHANPGAILSDPYNVNFEDITINFSTSP